MTTKKGKERKREKNIPYAIFIILQEPNGGEVGDAHHASKTDHVIIPATERKTVRTPATNTTEKG